MGGGKSCASACCKKIWAYILFIRGRFLAHGVAEHVGCLCCLPGVLADHPSQREEVTMIVASYPGLKTMHRSQSTDERSLARQAYS